MSKDCTLDGFVGHRLTIAQPRRGFRAGHDSVLLAAAVPAESGSEVLELGAGAGVASLCLALRVPGARVLGVEIDAELVRLANENAAENGMGKRVRFELGDAARLRGCGEAFDHVFFNPPFYPSTGQESPIAARDRARRDSANAVEEWTRVALGVVKPGGTVTAILPASRRNGMIEAGAGHGAVVFPLFPRAGEAVKRDIVQLRKSSKEPVRRAAGLILHEADGRNTQAAEAILRHGAGLKLV
jgi:tRNA1(Val) A37 N6-methylase TrmN6